MPRQVRIQYPGAVCHAMSRGNRRQDIFLDDADRQDFLRTLAEACQKTGWQVHAYCLMSNHSAQLSKLLTCRWLQQESPLL
jgi:REP element-mobilizing transposase RayT